MNQRRRVTLAKVSPNDGSPLDFMAALKSQPWEGGKMRGKLFQVNYKKSGGVIKRLESVVL